MTHAIKRTTPTGPGYPFRGRCIKCGEVGLTMGDALLDCPADAIVSDEAALRQIIEAPAEDAPSFAAIVDLIGELGREVFNLIDNCETRADTGRWGDPEIHEITEQDLIKVSDVLDRIDALPFEEPGCILGTGAMLQAALKQTFAAEIARLKGLPA